MIKESHFEIEHKMAVLKMVIIPQIKRLVFDLALRSPRFDPRTVGGQSGTGTGIFPSTSFYLTSLCPPEIHAPISFLLPPTLHNPGN
jgi:hypothetical protein